MRPIFRSQAYAWLIRETDGALEHPVLGNFIWHRQGGQGPRHTENFRLISNTAGSHGGWRLHRLYGLIDML